ncbi:MAG: MBL fold metallo-hydrolase [Oligoflexia bacterium]|nr:MBL fold metallo-hydrolase [Oligoflexia bacterium]
MKIKVWGTRGSIATPEIDKMKYGGNTTCIEVEYGHGHHFIVDAGSGLRKLSNQLIHSKSALKMHFLFTHAHWDHLSGFPFFLPIYSSKNSFFITGFSKIVHDFRHIIAEQMNGIYFPVMFESIASSIDFVEFENIKLNCAGCSIDKIKLNHPGGGYGYKFTENGKHFVFLTDNELSYEHEDGALFQDYVDFCRGADVLFHDSQYDNERYQFTKGWGHSTFDDAFELGVAAGVKSLMFCHHDPDTTDKMLDEKVKEYRKRIKTLKVNMNIDAVREGLVLQI